MENTVRVAKVPNPDIKQRQQDSRNLPKMPRLYLELIENKDKIKQGLVNKEYDPDDAASDITFFGNTRDDRMEKIMSDIDEENSQDMLSSEEEEEDEQSVKNSVKHVPSTASSSVAEEDDVSSVATSSSTDMNTTDEEEESDDHPPFKQQESSTTPMMPQQQPSSKSQQYAKILNENLPPRLSDLERQGEIQNKQSIPNLDRIHPTEDEDDEMKRELLFKFELLKKAYKTEVPDFNVHSDLKQMSRSYESTLRRVSLDSCVENYKQLLIGGFMVLEFVLGYLFKFDMQGFTQQQILNMNQYERLLIELGEQSYVPGGPQWPVEVRLLLMVMGNAAIFIIAKMIMKKTGSNIMSAMNSFSRPQPSPMNKRKMRGPSIHPDDIPDISANDF